MKHYTVAKDPSCGKRLAGMLKELAEEYSLSMADVYSYCLHMALTVLVTGKYTEPMVRKVVNNYMDAYFLAGKKRRKDETADDALAN